MLHVPLFIADALLRDNGEGGERGPVVGGMFARRGYVMSGSCLEVGICRCAVVCVILRTVLTVYDHLAFITNCSIVLCVNLCATRWSHLTCHRSYELAPAVSPCVFPYRRLTSLFPLRLTYLCPPRPVLPNVIRRVTCCLRLHVTTRVLVSPRVSPVTTALCDRVSPCHCRPV